MRSPLCESTTRVRCPTSRKERSHALLSNLHNIYMLLTGWEVRIGKNCDRGLENAALGLRPRAAFSNPRSQFFTIRTDPKPDNNMFIFFSCGKLLTSGFVYASLSLNWLTRRLQTLQTIGKKSNE